MKWFDFKSEMRSTLVSPSIEASAEGFEGSLACLERFVARQSGREIERAAVIKAFDLTFEQSWRVLQRLAISSGVEVGNPKQAIANAMSSGWIDCEAGDHWMRMIEDRSLISQTWQQRVANHLFAQVVEVYLPLLQNLRNTLKTITDIPENP